MKVYIVIATYNGKQWYDRCFGSLRDVDLSKSTVVVDNASSDDTVRFTKCNYPEIKLIESKVNLGFGRANNIGIHYALDNGADYVFLLNQDAWIEKDTIEKLVSVHISHPDFGILSPVHLNTDRTEIEEFFRGYLSPLWGCNDFISDRYFNKTKEVYETNFVSAAAWLLSRKCIQTVGFFDSVFFHYGEDDNYAQRVLYHKFKIGIVPESRAVHDSKQRVISNNFVLNQRIKDLLIYFSDVRNDNFKEIPKVILSFWLKAFYLLLKFKPREAKQSFREGLMLAGIKKLIVRNVKVNREASIKF